MLRKIDCVMVRVNDLDEAVDFYTRTFGLRSTWRDESSAGLKMPQTDAEIVLHTMTLPSDGVVHYLVDDVGEAVSAYRQAGCGVRVPPFEIAIGLCAVVEDPYGNAVCILDMSKGPRT
jgi:lactoylglutathione lyase